MKYSIPVLMFLLAGCAGVSVIPLKDFSTRNPAAIVDFYASKESVKRPYKEIALLSYKTEGSPEKAARKLREKAAEIGADGVILDRTETHQQIVPLFIGGAMASADSYTHQGIAIIYTDAN